MSGANVAVIGSMYRAILYGQCDIIIADCLSLWVDDLGIVRCEKVRIDFYDYEWEQLS